ncbi:Ig-like domain-containing protein [Candidatus Palauibacter irciniicola]|uniref:Ig-like domain-containing protein n=1 Tax=Candidatus Palauibacter irciniicola TaxID=3056733 RepID=UPI003B027382
MRWLTHASCLTAVLAVIAACGGDGMAPPAVPPPPPAPPPPPPQTAPVPVGSIADRTVDAGQSFTVDVSSNFRDSDGDALTYAAESSDEGVATARAAGSQVNVEAVGPGTASVTVTASDPGGRTAAQSFGVSVRGSFGDDFGSAASLADWTERNNTGISVGGGVLSVTNRTQGRLGVAERASTPTLNSWMVAARMGRTTRKASPGVVSVTGHRRFTAARLVLRTIDDSGRDQNRSADASRTSGNFEFALFDRDTREWVRVANMSGSSVAIREEPNEFTEIVIGHEGVDFVGYAGAGNSEELFRFNLDDSSVDDVPLRDVLEHVTGVWLVNQGDAGLTALHDWVEVTGTGSGATVPDVAEVAAALDAATRSVSVGGPDADRAALVALYEATDGPNWTNNDGWLTDAPVHDWHGVDETDGRGRVRALHLDENNLSGEIPPEIGNLSALRRLFVSRNRLVGSIPAEIGNLSALESLSAEGNELTGEIPPELGDLSNLRSLWVPRNQLVGAIPPEFGNLAALVTLSLGDNELTGAIPREFGRLANLDWMNLGGNRLTGEIPPELGALSNLRYLGLLKNELTGAIPAELGDLTALLDLELYSNRLTGEIPPELGGLANLNSLNLALNELSGRLPATFLNLSLARFWWNENAALCAPDTSAFRTWLAGIGDHHPGPFCVEGPEAVGTVPAQVVSVGQSATVDVSPYFRDSDGDPLTYTALSGNAAVVTASVSGSALTVTGAARGRATIAVKATDPAGLSATQTVAVTVTTPNRAPQPVGTIPAMRLSVGGSGSVDVSSYFRDPDGDALTYATSSSNVRVATATMSGTVLTVTGAGVGSATVTVTAADPAGLAAAQTVAVRVGNRAPQPVGTIPAISLTVGASHTLDASVYFRDPDGDALAYRVRSTIPGVAAASVSGRIVTIAGVSLGRATLTLTAVDPAGLTATQTVAVAVVQTANRPPQVRSGLRIEGLPAGQSHMHDMVEGRHFIDPDGDVLSFAAVSRNPDIVDGTMDGNVLTVTGVAPGEGVVAVTATDPAGLSATLDVEVLVIESDNRAPEAVGTILDQTLEYGEETSLDISSYFRDPDGDPLTFTASSSDDDVVVATMWEQNNRLLVLNAGSEEDGTVTVTVTATDPGGLTATQTVSVTVG